jgi:hypothetical protein
MDNVFATLHSVNHYFTIAWCKATGTFTLRESLAQETKPEHCRAMIVLWAFLLASSRMEMMPEWWSNCQVRMRWRALEQGSERERQSTVCIRFTQVESEGPCANRQVTTKEVEAEVLGLVNNIGAQCFQHADNFVSGDIRYQGFEDLEGKGKGMITFNRRKASLFEVDAAIGCLLGFYLGNGIQSHSGRAYKWCPFWGIMGATSVRLTSITSAFMDDITTLAQDNPGSQILIDAIQEFEDWSNMRLNLGKTVVMDIDGVSGQQDPPILTYKGRPVKTFQAEDSCRHLGFWATPNGDMAKTKQRERMQGGEGGRGLTPQIQCGLEDRPFVAALSEGDNHRP